MKNRAPSPAGAGLEALGRAGAGLPALPRAWLANARAWEEGPELLHLAWELSRCAPDVDAATQRALLLLGFAALLSIREGSTRTSVKLDAVRAQLAPLELGELEFESIRALVAKPELGAPVLARAGAYAPLLLEGEWLWTARMRRTEDSLCELLIARLRAEPLAPAKKLRAAIDAAGKNLSDEQRDAVGAALAKNFAVVSGGPGTGKTSTVVGILRALTHAGVEPSEIALAAPTGKAAARLDEAIARALGEHDVKLRAGLAPAATLHRLLGSSPTSGRFVHHARNPLAARAVIVDEGSMIDLVLMERLLRCLRPDARLVLLGDADQLPSVDAGAVFRDLVAPANPQRGDLRARASVRLTKSFRQNPDDGGGRAVLEAASAVNAGRSPPLELREHVDALKYVGAEMLEANSELERGKFLDAWRARHRDAEQRALVRRAFHFGSEGQPLDDIANLEKLFARAESARLLCLHRSERELSGTGGANAFLHARALAELRSEGDLRGEPELLPGEPVLVERNDYARNLFNGDSGLVLRAVLHGESRQRFAAVFRTSTGFRAFALDGLRGRISLGHALTVHKAQGTEAEQVALMLPSRDGPLLTRELVYTALTRARRGALVVGARALLDAAIARVQQRSSALAERLADAT